MIKGMDQLAIINQHISTARNALDSLHQRKEAASQQLLQLRSQMTDAYRSLARFRLEELAADRLVTHLDETDQTVLKLIDRRAQALQALDPEIEQSASRITSLNAEREQVILRRDALVKKIDDHAADIQEGVPKKGDVVVVRRLPEGSETPSTPLPQGPGGPETPAWLKKSSEPGL